MQGAKACQASSCGTCRLKKECEKLREEAEAQTAAALGSKKASAEVPMYYFTNEPDEKCQEKPKEKGARDEAHHDSAEQLPGHADSEKKQPVEGWWHIVPLAAEQGIRQGRGEQSFYERTK